ncbi:MAG: plasmid pRiA4b ORF-3 family protein [Bacteroidales bacterium]|nr:plasmid pRiA4b ORF-3 family protein [Bacteroidales bacterium]
MSITLKVQIRGIKQPPVWRRLVIPDSFTFADLHCAIQEAFGWGNYHLYQFQKQPYGSGWCFKDPRAEEYSFDNEGCTRADEGSVLSVVEFRKEQKFVYVYDFGDDWIHDITVEDVDHSNQLDCPICTGGKSACPEEDCGGVWNYMDLREDMDEDEIKEFDLVSVNEALKSAFAPKITKKDSKKGSPKNAKSNGEQTLDEKSEDDSITMMDVLEDWDKEDVKWMASCFGLSLSDKLDEESYKQQYVREVLADISNTLFYFSVDDLHLLTGLLETKNPDFEVPLLDSFVNTVFPTFGFGLEDSTEDGLWSVRLASDFWQAARKEVKKTLKSKAYEAKCTFESMLIGMANVYGIISLEEVYDKLIELEVVDDVPSAKDLFAEVRNASIRLQDMSRFSQSGKEFLCSLYADILASEFPFEELERKRKATKDFKSFGEIDFLNASVCLSRFDLENNPPLVKILTEDLGLSIGQAITEINDL